MSNATFLEFYKQLDSIDWKKEKKKQKNKRRGLGKGQGGISGSFTVSTNGSAESGTGGEGGGVSESTKYPNMVSREEEEGDITNKANADNLGNETEIAVDGPGLGGDAESVGDGELGIEDELENEDPNRQGLIRTIKGAHLVYKRQDDDGQFEEMWIFNLKKGINDEQEIRHNILAGTDIPENKLESEDGSQHYTLWTAGNAQIMKISGLPN